MAAAGVRACSLRAVAPHAGAALRFLGHASSGELVDADGAEAPMPPRAVTGAFLARSDAAQSFARTAVACSTGMCGGPVLLEADDGSERGGDGDLDCVGMLEGVVTPPADGAGGEPQSAKQRAASLLAGAAVFIDAQVLRNFVAEVDATAER